MEINAQNQNLTKKEKRALKRQIREENRTINLSAKKRKKIIGWGILGTAAVFIVLIIVWFAPRGGQKEFTFELDAQNSYKGNKEASVVIREFSDFQCPACRVAYFNIKQFMDEYKDRVKFIYYDFPLVSIHKNAMPAAIAARCAEARGYFWEYHDLLFESQKNWESLKDTIETFTSYAKELDMDEAAFSACLNEERYKDTVQRNLDKAYKLGLNSTPTIFIGDEKFTGVMSVDQLREKVNSLLNRQRP